VAGRKNDLLISYLSVASRDKIHEKMGVRDGSERGWEV
jgi:hypothetical protein